MQRSSAATTCLALIGAFLCSAIGCTPSLPGRTYVVIKLTGNLEGVTRWLITAALDGQTVPIRDPEFDQGGTRFSLEFWDTAAGQLTITVKGLAEYPFVLSKGALTLPVHGELRINKEIAMQRAEVCTREGWCWDRPLPSGRTISALWGSGPTDIWAGGGAGLLLHYDGRAWDLVPTETEQDVTFLYGLSATDVYAGCSSGAILHYDGTQWTALSPPAADKELQIIGIWAGGPHDVWFLAQTSGSTVGTPYLLRWNGTGWQSFTQANQQLPLEGRAELGGIWGIGPGEPWLLGIHKSGTAMRTVFLLRRKWNGAGYEWEDLTRGTMAAPLNHRCLALAGRSADDVWVSCGSEVLRLGKDARLTSIAVPIPGHIGPDGMPTHYDWTRFNLAENGDVYLTGSEASNGDATLVGSVTFQWRQGSWAQLPDPLLPNDVQVRALWSDEQSLWLGATAGVIRRLDRKQGAWSAQLPDHLETLGNYLASISGTSPQDIWVVGAAYARDGGTDTKSLILHQDGKGWAPVEVKPPPDVMLHDVWAAPGKSVWVVGDKGLTLRYDGTAWQAKPTGGLTTLRSVWSDPSGQAWAVGDSYKVFRWDGSQWGPVTQPLTPEIGCYFSQVWGIPDGTVWVIGGNDGSPRSSVLLERSAGVWKDRTPELKTVPLPYLTGSASADTQRPPRALWASSASNLWIGGTNWKHALYFNGTGWQIATWCTADNSDAIWGISPDEIWCMTSNGRTAVGKRKAVDNLFDGGPVPGSGGDAAPSDMWSSGSEIWSVARGGAIFHRRLQP